MRKAVQMGSISTISASSDTATAGVDAIRDEL